MMMSRRDDKSPILLVLRLLEPSARFDVHAALYDAGLTAISSFHCRVISKPEVGESGVNLVERVTAHTVNQVCFPRRYFVFSRSLGFSLLRFRFILRHFLSSLASDQAAVSFCLFEDATASPPPRTTTLDSPDAWIVGPALGLYMGERNSCGGCRGVERAMFKIRIFRTRSSSSQPGSSSSNRRFHRWPSRIFRSSDRSSSQTAAVSFGGCRSIFAHPVEGCRRMYCLIGRARIVWKDWVLRTFRDE
jgi:hypothetical protein